MIIGFPLLIGKDTDPAISRPDLNSEKRIINARVLGGDTANENHRISRGSIWKERDPPFVAVLAIVQAGVIHKEELEPPRECPHLAGSHLELLGVFTRLHELQAIGLITEIDDKVMLGLLEYAFLISEA